MKKTLLTMAVTAMAAMTAFAGTPEKFNLTYDVREVNDNSELTSLVLNVGYPLGNVSQLTLDKSKQIQITASEGYTFTASSMEWNRQSALTVNFSPAVTDPGTYTIELPEGLFNITGANKVSAEWIYPDAFTIEAPAPRTDVDVISVVTINAARPAGDKLQPKDPEDYEFQGQDGTLIGSASGNTYKYVGACLATDNPKLLAFAGWTSYITNETSDSGYIQQVTGVGGAYFSMEPMTVDNYYAGDWSYTENGEPIVPNGPAKYVYFAVSPMDQISEITIEWGSEPTEGHVLAPTLYTNYYDLRPGTVVSATSYTNGATVYIHAISSTGVDETVSGEPGTGTVSYPLAGEAGTTWTITAWAEKEGLEPSEQVTETYTLATPQLMEPNISYPSNDFGEHMPVNALITISNQNYVGTTYYQVNNGEVLSTEEMEFTLRAVGGIGDAFEVCAWVEAEGFLPSEKAIAGAYLVDNTLPAPTFTPAAGSVLEGTMVQIVVADEVEEIVYRVDEGEWITAPNFPWEPVEIKIEKDCTIEAYSSPGDPETASYVKSETVTAKYVVEALGDDEVLLNKEILEVEMMPAVYDVENQFGKFEYNGFTMDSNLPFEDAYYEEDVVDENEYLRNVEVAADMVISAVKANMVKGSMAVFFADEKIENTLEMYNNDRTDYVVLGGEEAEAADHTWAASGAWYELNGDNADKKFFFARGYNEAVLQSFLVRFAKLDSVQTIEDLTEAEARYFTIDGVEANPNRLAPGIYVRVLGSKAEKVIVR